MNRRYHTRPSCQPVVVRGCELPSNIQGFGPRALEVMEERYPHELDVLYNWYGEILGTLRAMDAISQSSWHPEQRSLDIILSSSALVPLNKLEALEGDIEFLIAAWALDRVVRRVQSTASGDILRNPRYKAETGDTFTGSREDQDKMSPYYRGR